MGLSRSKQPSRPTVQPGFNQPGFANQQQPGFNNQQPGFPNQTPGFPPNQPPLNNQAGMPPNQPGFPSNHSGFPPGQQQPFPPGAGQNGGFPNQPGFPTQSTGFSHFPPPSTGFPPNHHGFPNLHPAGPGFSAPPFPGPLPPNPQQGGFAGFPPPVFPPNSANCAQVFPVNYGNQSMRPLIPGYASAPSHERRGGQVVAQDVDPSEYGTRYYTEQVVSKSRKH